MPLLCRVEGYEASGCASLRHWDYYGPFISDHSLLSVKNAVDQKQTLTFTVNLLSTRVPSQSNGEKKSPLKKRCWDKRISTRKRVKLDLYLVPYIKIKSKQIKGLHRKFKTIKFLDINTGINLSDLGSGNGFLDMTPKAQATKGKKIDKWDHIKIKSLCASKYTIRKVKRPPT